VRRHDHEIRAPQVAVVAEVEVEIEVAAALAAHEGAAAGLAELGEVVVEAHCIAPQPDPVVR